MNREKPKFCAREADRFLCLFVACIIAAGIILYWLAPKDNQVNDGNISLIDCSNIAVKDGKVIAFTTAPCTEVKP